ncbi:hypothetical protein OHC33_009283 [Knufia fluminis]|uniref:Uncharacterized protein n=2 Tax=Knufia TaxID=430999 RepID=A0AAN8I4Z2_9EURO|nr:hypothetical protein OHC33_009283 [Knufia fluminis]
MMTNGTMEESINKEASLSNVEPEVFGQLLQSAYRGLCGVSEGVNGQPVRADPPAQFTCHRCDSSVNNGDTTEYYPFCTHSCSASYKQCARNASTGSHTYTVFCAVYNCGTSMTLRNATPPDWICMDCFNYPSHRKEYPKNEAALGGAITSAIASGPQFRARLYGCRGLTHREFSDHIESHRSGCGKASDLVEQAKVYIFANQYMIADLEDVALHKMHRNLNAFNLNADTIDDLIDLHLLTYADTSDDGDILKGTSDRLRDLVMGYIADRASDLSKYETFRAMLGAGGPQTADFIALTFAKK